MRIWLFYNRQGEWGLKYRGKWHTAKTVDVQIQMRGRMRAGASPNAYLTGDGLVVRNGDHVTLSREQHGRR